MVLPIFGVTTSDHCHPTTIARLCRVLSHSNGAMYRTHLARYPLPIITFAMSARDADISLSSFSLASIYLVMDIFRPGRQIPTQRFCIGRCQCPDFPWSVHRRLFKVYWLESSPVIRHTWISTKCVHKVSPLHGSIPDLHWFTTCRRLIDA